MRIAEFGLRIGWVGRREWIALAARSLRIEDWLGAIPDP